MMLIKLHLVAHLDFGLEVLIALEWWIFKAHLQTEIVFPLSCLPLMLNNTYRRADGELTYRVSSL